jgi:hypothetical protein
VANKPPDNLFSKGLADIDENVLVSSIVVAIVYQEGGVTPEEAERHAATLALAMLTLYGN